MVLDLMAQLDREFTQPDTRELLCAKRNRNSEQLSVDQLDLSAALWQARQTEGEAANATDADMTMTTKSESLALVRQLPERSQVTDSPCRGI